MVFSDTSAEKNGLLQECEFQIFGDNGYGKISGNAALLATFTRGLNEGLNEVSSAIMQADHRWQMDDTNRTDLPIGTRSLVADQQDYTLDTAHLRILRVEVKDQEGNWDLLQPIDQSDIYDTSLTDFLKTSGAPRFYDKSATSLFLYPKPNYSQASSLKVYFQRGPSYFVTTDTAKEPGFNSLYHKIVAHIACRDYAIARRMPKKDDLAALALQGLQRLADDYALRNKDEHIKLTTKKYRFN